MRQSMVVYLKKWELSDAAALAEVLSDKKLRDHLRDGIPYPYTEQDGREFIMGVLSDGEQDVFSFAVMADGALAGTISLFRQGNIHRQTAELGYYLAENFWGKGIMTEAVRQACRYVFANSDVIRIYAEPFAHNLASCRVLEKAGFHYEGTLRSNAVKDGNVIDMRMYSRLRTDGGSGSFETREGHHENGSFIHSSEP